MENGKSLPNWYTGFKSNNANCGEVVKVLEWDNESNRNSDGFVGTDFCHSAQSHVRILEYFLYNNGATHHSLLGAVYFSPHAESGRGYCHGGSMCAIMDDAVGWMGFCYTGSVKPWNGFTVQVNTSLKKPVPVHSLLRLNAWVDRLEGKRKVWIKCNLVDPDNSSNVYSECEGLFLIKDII